MSYEGVRSKADISQLDAGEQLPLAQNLLTTTPHLTALVYREHNLSR